MKKKTVSAPKRRRIKRDPKALEKTLAFVLERAGKTTSVKQAARHFGISNAAAANRLGTLAKLGQVSKLARGQFGGLGTVPTVAGQDPYELLLGDLLEQREQLDAKIAKCKEVIALKRQWTAGKAGGS